MKKLNAMILSSIISFLIQVYIIFHVMSQIIASIKLLSVYRFAPICCFMFLFCLLIHIKSIIHLFNGKYDETRNFQYTWEFSENTKSMLSYITNVGNRYHMFRWNTSFKSQLHKSSYKDKLHIRLFQPSV